MGIDMGINTCFMGPTKGLIMPPLAISVSFFHTEAIKWIKVIPKLDVDGRPRLAELMIPELKCIFGISKC